MLEKMPNLILIIILLILIFLLFLNLDCIMEGISRENKAFCFHQDFGLSRVGLRISSSQGCTCYP
ncbi:MAG: hypothetical protein QXS48_00455 [Candidatus Aenigmatarchaeota archaeon]